MTVRNLPTSAPNDEAEEAIANNWKAVVARALAAATRVGRRLEDVTIVAVTKTHPAWVARAAVKAGATDLGENYVQEMAEKRAELADGGAEPRWHFLGHLQRNKAKYLAGWCHLIHSVDSFELAVEIDRQAAKAGATQAILVQVDLAGEETKFGVPADEAVAMTMRAAELEHVRVAGLMTIPPWTEDAEASRPIYRRLAELAAEMRGAGLKGIDELSMGMTQDFETAIEEGATLVRVGTAIFGARR
jgi:pyridoxal phosphate enzyme (YggS family)